MTVDFSCVFGMSSGVPGLEAGQQMLRINDGWSLMVIPSRTDIVYWFIMQKLDQTYTYATTPRYTQEEAAAACSRLVDVPVWKHIRFGDIWEKRRVFNMLALQEGIFQTWHTGRLVCLGDSIHKVRPCCIPTELLDESSCRE